MRILAVLAALSLFTAPAAHAQPPAHRHEPVKQARPTPKKAEPRKLSHAERCKARFASYNPRTDRYTVKPGVTRRCML
ncbi:MAG: BA14K family protein [Sphingobium sp.]